MAQTTRAARRPLMAAADMARHLDEHMAPLPEGFASWLAQWRVRNDARQAFRAFDELRSPRVPQTGEDETAEALTAFWRMASACFHAERYAAGDDAGPVFRRRARSAKERADDLAPAAAELARAFRFHHAAPMLTGDCLPRALAKAGIDAHIGGGRVPGRAWGLFFDGLAAALKDYEAPRVWESFTTGNLYFPKAKATGRPVEAPTMLVFELALHARMWKLGRIREIYSTPMPVPKGPMPRGAWSLVATWASVTLKTTMTREQARARLKPADLPPGVALVPWSKVARR